MQVPVDVLRNLYRLVVLKGTCYVSELPVLYKSQCGSDLNYRELGFPLLTGLTEKCAPYIKQTFDADTGQWCLSVGRRLPSSMMHEATMKNAPTSHDIELASAFLFSGKFKCTNLKLPLSCMTCSLCYGLIKEFRVWTKCHHGVCIPCYEKLSPDDACCLCSHNEEDEVQGIPLIQLTYEMLQQFHKLQCKCPFEHARSQFMSIEQFHSHFSQCPLNTEFTGAKVVEQTLLDDSDCSNSEDDDDNDAALQVLTDTLAETITDHINTTILSETIQLPKTRTRKSAATNVKTTSKVNTETKQEPLNELSRASTTAMMSNCPPCPSGVLLQEDSHVPLTYDLTGVSSSSLDPNKSDSIDFFENDKLDECLEFEALPNQQADSVKDLSFEKEANSSLSGDSASKSMASSWGKSSSRSSEESYDSRSCSCSCCNSRSSVTQRSCSSSDDGNDLASVVDGESNNSERGRPGADTMLTNSKSKTTVIMNSNSAEPAQSVKLIRGVLFVYRAFSRLANVDATEHTPPAPSLPAYAMSVQPGEKVKLLSISKGFAGWVFCRRIKKPREEGWVPTQAFRKTGEDQEVFATRLKNKLEIANQS